MKKKITIMLVLAMLISVLSGCSLQERVEDTTWTEETVVSSVYEEAVSEATAQRAETVITTETDRQPTETEPTATTEETTEQTVSFSAGDIPAYSGDLFVHINGNRPYFDEEELSVISFEDYSPLDSLGRCGTATASVGPDIMPTEDRQSISEIHPSGWHNEKYDFVDGGYVYNRCHLIGFQLTGENANERNLITGTRCFNVEGMLPFEDLTADYVHDTENHVMYRVTPVYDGNNLVATGVLMEGISVEDGGEDVCFCVFVYNVQPGVEIDYATGYNKASAGHAEEETTAAGVEATYVLNTNTGKFHRPECSSVNKMKESNKQYYTGTRESLIEQGYEPCKNCDP